MPYFMKPGDAIKGSSLEAGFEQWVEIDNAVSDASAISVSTSVQNSNRVSGRVSQSEFMINAKFDKAMAEIIAAFMAGEPLGTVQIVQTRQDTDGQAHTWSQHELFNTYVSSFSINVSGYGDSYASVALNFNQLAWEYRIQKNDGTAKGTVKGGWDFTINKPLATVGAAAPAA